MICHRFSEPLVFSRKNAIHISQKASGYAKTTSSQVTVQDVLVSLRQRQPYCSDPSLHLPSHRVSVPRLVDEANETQKVEIRLQMTCPSHRFYLDGLTFKAM